MSHDAISLLTTLPPMIERYELKYVVPQRLVEPICQFLEPCCALDAYSKSAPNYFYPVNSLYFDTPNLRFLQLRMWGAARRFNMRVRAYGDGLQGPYFAEIKFKTPTNVRKFRALIDASHWPAFLHEHATTLPTQLGVASADNNESTSRDLFVYLARAYAIEPRIFTCYRRRAFVSRIDAYARVTFDIDLRYRHQTPHAARAPFSLQPGPDCVSYDAETIFTDQHVAQGDVVLELKATAGAVPVWMIEMIRRFELKQVGFSKYLNSSLIGHEDNGSHYMTPDRMSSGAVHDSFRQQQD